MPSQRIDHTLSVTEVAFLGITVIPMDSEKALRAASALAPVRIADFPFGYGISHAARTERGAYI